MILSNTEQVPGRTIREFYGVVTGSTVRAKHIGRDIMAGLKNIVGGELKGYTELLQEARQEAIDRMIQQAQSVGANAISSEGRPSSVPDRTGTPASAANRSSRSPKRPRSNVSR